MSMHILKGTIHKVQSLQSVQEMRENILLSLGNFLDFQVNLSISWLLEREMDLSLYTNNKPLSLAQVSEKQLLLCLRSHLETQGSQDNIYRGPINQARGSWDHRAAKERDCHLIANTPVSAACQPQMLYSIAKAFFFGGCSCLFNE